MSFSAFHQEVTHLYYPCWAEQLLTYLCPSLLRLEVSRYNGGKTTTQAPVVQVQLQVLFSLKLLLFLFTISD